MTIADYIARFKPGTWVVLQSLIPMFHLHDPLGGPVWTMACRVLDADERGVLYRAPTGAEYFQPWPSYPLYLRIVDGPIIR